MLLVEHTHCATHGELVHAVEAHHHAPSERAVAAMPSFDVPSGDAQEEAHEHCTMSTDRRDAVWSLADASPVGRIDGTPNREPAQATRPISKTERFRIAPKNSPPA